ncbi:MAG: MATE family efflux transporter [Desulfitobacteriia bacterium]
MAKKYNLLEGNIFAIYKKFVSTSIAGMLMVSFYILFDTIFIGQGVGPGGLAALNISIPIFNLFFGTGMLIGIGSATVMSINVGHKNIVGARQAFEHSLILGVITGALYSLGSVLFLEELMVFLGAGPESEPLIREYLGVILPFSWAFLLVQNLAIIVRNDQGPKRAMLAMGIGSITNVILDYILIFPLQMGMRGAAIASVLAALLSLFILAWHFLGGHSTFRIKSFRLRAGLIRRIAVIGLAAFIIEISSGLIIYLYNQELLKLIGDIGVSAYSIIANISLMAVALFTGIAQGVQPIASTNFGARKLNRVYKVRKYGIFTALAFGSLFMFTGLLIPETIISAFTTETGEFVNIAREGIRIYFLAFPIMGLNVFLNGFFQAIERPRYSTLISLLRGIVLTFIWLKILPPILGLRGIWLTTPISETLTFLIISGILGIQHLPPFKKTTQRVSYK